MTNAGAFCLIARMALLFDPDNPMAFMRGSSIVLLDNEWSACTIDGFSGDWGRVTQQNPHGFSTMNAGRHQVLTLVRGQLAQLDIVLYPGESVVRRLDREAGRWVLADPETERKYLELASQGHHGPMAGVLVDYSRVHVSARGLPPKIAGNDVLQRVCGAFINAAQALAAGTPLDQLLPTVNAAGDELIGLVVDDEMTLKMVGLVHGLACKAGAAQDYRLAAQVLILGFGIVPGDPILIDLMANFYADTGRPEVGMKSLDEAMRRFHVVAPQFQKAMKETYAEITEALQKKGAAG